ncbi:hypothetical protein S245_025652 [Arachis hypogaea]
MFGLEVQKTRNIRALESAPRSELSEKKNRAGSQREKVDGGTVDGRTKQRRGDDPKRHRRRQQGQKKRRNDAVPAACSSAGCRGDNKCRQQKQQDGKKREMNYLIWNFFI